MPIQNATNPCKRSWLENVASFTLIRTTTECHRQTFTKQGAPISVPGNLIAVCNEVYIIQFPTQNECAEEYQNLMIYYYYCIKYFELEILLQYVSFVIKFTILWQSCARIRSNLEIHRRLFIEDLL